jgi:hypothetical protein
MMITYNDNDDDDWLLSAFNDFFPLRSPVAPSVKVRLIF